MEPEDPQLAGFRTGAVCAILDACKRNDVRSFTLGPLCIEFLPSRPRGNVDWSGDQPEAAEPAPGPVVLEDVSAAESLPLSPEEEELREEARRAQLLNDSPSDYEREMIDALQDDVS